MANDVIFKTKTFGGFDKEQVMTYINQLIAEKGQLEEKCNSLMNLNATLNEKAGQVEGLSAQIEALKIERDDALKNIESLNNELQAKNTELDDVNTKLASLKAEYDELKNTPVFNEEQAELLKAENIKLKAECDKMKAMEQQVGAAMLDARLRSDELVKEAEEKANNVRKDVYDAIGDTAVKIDELSGGITEIARNFTKAVSEVEMRINVLTGNMSKTAQALISNNFDAAKIQGATDDTVEYTEVEVEPVEANEEATEALDNELNKKVVVKVKEKE